MTPPDGHRRPGQARVVMAAITHVSGRVLAIQRVGDDTWRLPGGPVAPPDVMDVRLRAYVRAATGFEIRRLTPTGSHATPDGVVEFVRCEIRGVGADISSRTRTLRWMDRDAIAALVDPATARGMLDALDAAVGARPPRVVSPTLLAS